MGLAQRLIIDCRLLYSSGIGRYLQEQIPVLATCFDTTLLLRKQDVAFAVKHSVKYKIVNAAIYSVKEQIAFVTAGNKNAMFWSPHYNVPCLYLQSRARIVTIHDVCHLALPGFLSPMKRLYARLVMQSAVDQSDKIITVSEFSKKEIIRYTGCPEEKITVVHNGIRKAPTEGNSDSVNARYGLPPYYFLYVGNVKPHKNLAVFLQAYLLLNASLRQKYKVVIVGKKHGYITGDQALMQWIASSPELKNQILFTGYVVDEDLDDIYRHASLFVFPSLYEGFGLPPLEAMRNGCPVICSNTASMPEVCGDAALYFDPTCPKQLSQLLEEALSDNTLYTSLIERGKIRLEQFSWEKSVNQHVQLFESLS